MKRIISVLAIAAILLVTGCFAEGVGGNVYKSDDQRYRDAVQDFMFWLTHPENAKNKTEELAEKSLEFNSLGNTEQAGSFVLYIDVLLFVEKGDYLKARASYDLLSLREDFDAHLKTLIAEKRFPEDGGLEGLEAYMNARKAETDGKYDEAAMLYGKSKSFYDSTLRVRELILGGKANNIKTDPNEEKKKALYDVGLEKLNVGDFLSAIDFFAQASGYLDAEEKRKESYYRMAEDSLGKNQQKDAIRFFGNAGDYKDAAGRAATLNGDLLFAEENYAEALKYYQKANDTDRQKECNYQIAKQKQRDGKEDEAISLYVSLEGYLDSELQIQDIYYKRGQKAQEDLDWSRAASEYERAGSYTDSELRARYCLGRKMIEERNYVAARAIFEGLKGYGDVDEWLNGEILATPSPTPSSTPSPSPTPVPDLPSASSWRCFNCLYVNESRSDYCEECGQHRICVECGTKVLGKDHSCLICGIELDHWKCKECGAMNAFYDEKNGARNEYCEVCGAKWKR